MIYIICRLYIIFSTITTQYNTAIKENAELKEYRKNAMLLMIEQNDLIDIFQSSRNAKLKNDKIQELSLKLN